MTGWMWPGARNMPTMTVKTTSDITFGLRAGDMF